MSRKAKESIDSPDLQPNRKEQVEHYLEKNFGVRSIKEIHLRSQLPPPVYSNLLSTDQVRVANNRSMKLVKIISRNPDGSFLITGVEGTSYIVPVENVHYWRDE